MDGMLDIIPPVAVHGGLTGLVEQSGLPTGLLLGVAALLLGLLAAGWWMRRSLIARLRLARARRHLLAGRAGEADWLLRRHMGLAHLHPAHPPHGIAAETWRALVEGLHEARFGSKTMESAGLSRLLSEVFTPTPLREEGASVRPRENGEGRP